MATGKSRLSEAEVNNALGRILRLKNVRWRNCIESEKTGVIKQAAGKRPDIIVNHPGSLPVIIESEFEPARTVEDDAQSRLGSVLLADDRRIEQVIALKIPSNIVTVKQQHLDDELSTAVLRYALLTVDGWKQARWPEKGYIEGGIDDFVNFVEQTALSESIMTRGTTVLEHCISAAANIVQYDRGTPVSTQEKLALILKQDEGEQTTRMAMAILANAVSFHNTIANQHNIKPLMELHTQSELGNEWKYILDEINYWPIFHIARKILGVLQSRAAMRVIELLVQSSSALEKIGVTSQHDLSGRMLQRLIADRKFLATFYTLPSSAALLAELAVSRLETDWSKSKEIKKLQIADFACGTGALLNAAYSTVLSKYRRTGGNDGKLHKPMMENVLVGTDIMPAATHMTASILSSAHPQKKFSTTRIITLPYGRNENAGGYSTDLGALDLIEQDEAFSLFQTSKESVKAKEGGNDRKVSIPHNSFDLVIMNPPFTKTNSREGTSSKVPIPAFAAFSTSPDIQYQMATKLKSLSTSETAGGGNAGIASNFIDVADVKIKDGGVLALILPFTFANSNAWKKTRTVLERLYNDITIISIATASKDGSAFSSDTSMGEVQIIATKSRRPNVDKPIVTYVNLTHRPTSISEAGVVSKTISKSVRKGAMGYLAVSEDVSFGNFLVSKNGFDNYAGIADVDVARTASALYDGDLLLPRHGTVEGVHLVGLRYLGDRGVGSRDVDSPNVNAKGIPRGPFYRTEIPPPNTFNQFPIHFFGLIIARRKLDWLLVQTVRAYPGRTKKIEPKCCGVNMLGSCVLTEILDSVLNRWRLV